jgi:hypothetical protein
VRGACRATASRRDALVLAGGGTDIYVARFANGALLVHIGMDSYHTINGLLLQPAP